MSKEQKQAKQETMNDEEVVVLRVKSRIRAGNYECDIRRSCDISCALR